MATTNEIPQRGFIFWAIAPFLLLLFVVNLFAHPTSEGGTIILVGFQILIALVFLGLFNGNRFWWAWRAVGFLVFLMYLSYLAQMLVESGGSIAFTPRRSEASAFSAICGLIAFGMPGLWFAIFGDLPSLREVEGEEDEFDE